MGAARLELDVRRTADGASWCTTTPVCPTGGRSSRRQRADLPAHVPTLDDALDACAGAGSTSRSRTTRPSPTSTPTIASPTRCVALRRRPSATPTWLISSFRLETRRPLPAARAPSVPTAWLTFGRSTSDDVDDVVPARPRGGPSRGGRPSTADADRPLPRRRLAVNAWTCDDPAQARELAAWGVDGICTDVPDVILAALGDHPSLAPERRFPQAFRAFLHDFATRIASTALRSSGHESCVHARFACGSHPPGRTRRTASGTWSNSRRLGLAEVVAVDLVRERASRARSTSVVEVDLLVERAGSACTPPPRSAPASAPQDRRGPQRAERDRRPARGRASAACDRSSGRLPRYVYGLVLSTIVK